MAKLNGQRAYSPWSLPRGKASEHDKNLYLALDSPRSLPRGRSIRSKSIPLALYIVSGEFLPDDSEFMYIHCWGKADVSLSDLFRMVKKWNGQLCLM